MKRNLIFAALLSEMLGIPVYAIEKGSENEGPTFKAPTENDKDFDVTVTTGEDANSTWREEKYVSKDGTSSFTRMVVTGKGAPATKKKEPTLAELKAQLQKHIDNQEYEKCVPLRDQIAKMEGAKAATK